ncbi:hypothetical protein [Asticcacaulis solisilvae]|uniref:hypothetical protein n=1 Tax=Asticcacaulis solisilvae TaxID=1217274 RepID=UPI003FD839C6
MLTILGLLASGVVVAPGPHYVVELTASQDNRLLAVSHMMAQPGQTSQLIQEDSGQRLSVKVTPKLGDGDAVKLDLAIEMSAEGGTVTRKTAMDVSLDGNHHFSVDVPQESDQPAAHFEFTVEEEAPGV